jgi:hypothetical protein
MHMILESRVSTPYKTAYCYQVQYITTGIHTIFRLIQRYLNLFVSEAELKTHRYIVAFGLGYAGTGGYLSPEFLDNPNRPPDSLLDWHFAQAVLANVKGDGEPVLEFEFTSGSDMLGQIREGPSAGKRMEMELFSRFADPSAPSESSRRSQRQ